MIEKINNWTFKSFANYTGPEEKFNKKNIIFGYNGKGKSSLAEGIKKEYFKNSENNEDNFRYFNVDYIKDNLMIEDSNAKLKGIKTSFSKKNVDITKEIKKIEENIIDTTQNKEKIEKINKELQEEINKIFNLKKGKTKIQKKSQVSIREQYKSYIEDLNPALKIINNEEELSVFSGDVDFETKIESLRNFEIFKNTNVTEKEVFEVSEILEKEYNNESIPTKTMIDWLEAGIIIHRDNNCKTCFFCNNESLNLSDIENKLKTFLDDAKQKDLIKVELVKEKIRSFLDNKTEINNNMLLFSKLIENNVDEEQTIISDCIEKLKELSYKITEKQKNISHKISINLDSYNECIKKINLMIENMAKTIKNRIEYLSNQNDKMNTLVKGSIAINIKNNSLIQNKIKELDEEELKLSKLNSDNIKYNGKISKLIESQQDIADFSTFLNEVLFNLGFNFELKPYDGNYYIKLKNIDGTLELNDISEGERNLLALLFFYYEIFEDEKFETINKNIELIIIDDPISSLDNNNKLFIKSLIKQLVEKSKAQVFVLTHSWEDFCDISYGVEKEQDYSLFEIKKIEAKSIIVKTKNHETPYKHNFKELNDFSNKKEESDLTECEMYHYPNIMRKVLEEYLSIKISKVELKVTKVKIALCGNVNKSSNQDDIQIPLLLDICNIYSHKLVRDPNQILLSAKYLMRKIKEEDPNHFAAMTT